MPNRNGTGPFGDGRPGRAMGPCGRVGRGFGRRGSFGTGNGGRGYRFRGGSMDRFALPETASTHDFYSYDAESLKSRQQELQEQLKWVEERLMENKDKHE